MNSTGFLSSWRPPLVVVGVCAVILTAAPVVGAAPESAAEPATATVTVNTGSRDLNVRSAPSASSQKVGALRNGSQIVISCHTRGTVFSGGPYGLSTDLWNRLADGGYVTDAMLDTGSNEPVVPPCATESTRPAQARADGRTVTKNPGEVGTAMWGAMEKWYFATGEQSYPALRGAPRDLPAAARKAGWTVVEEPQARAMVVIPPGVLDAPDSGHVAWVDTTSRRPDGVYLRLTEMDTAGWGSNIWSGRTVKAQQGLAYILLP
ncbi:amidase [Mycobacterium sp. C31M]